MTDGFTVIPASRDWDPTLYRLSLRYLPIEALHAAMDNLRLDIEDRRYLTSLVRQVEATLMVDPTWLTAAAAEADEYAKKQLRYRVGDELVKAMLGEARDD
jgi:hypothetical protein